MAQQVEIAGVLFNDVPYIQCPDGNGVYHQFLDTTIASNAAAASDIAQGKLAYVNGSLVTGTNQGGGGGGIGTLLATKSLGTVQTTSTTAADTGQTVTVSNVNDYDMLIVETSVDSVINNRHIATVNIVSLTASSSIETKDTVSVASSYLNMKISSSDVVTSRSSGTANGIYPSGPSISNGNVTLPMYKRFQSAATGTINNSYTTRVYGLKLYELIGG